MNEPIANAHTSPSAAAAATAAKGFDLGEFICRPIVRQIPRWVHPNTITLTNHAANWVLMALAFIAPLLSRQQQIVVCLACAALNFVCLVLDCLDGMHARATKQTSKLGEVLDHWLDAFHVPLVGAGVCYALAIGPYALSIVHIMNAGLYCSQLIYYHFSRVFINTAGVEAQLGASALYVLAGVLIAVDPNSPTAVPSTEPWSWYVVGGWMHWVVHYIFPPITVYIDAYLTWAFVKRYDAVMMRAFADSVVLNGGYALAYLCGGMGTRGFILLLSLVSFRVTGQYVMLTILKRPFPGIDRWLYAWIAVLIGAAFVPPLALPALPLLPVGGSVSLLGLVSLPLPPLWTVQDVLPALCALHIIAANAYELAVNYNTIKRM